MLVIPEREEFKSSVQDTTTFPPHDISNNANKTLPSPSFIPLYIHPQENFRLPFYLSQNDVD